MRIGNSRIPAAVALGLAIIAVTVSVAALALSGVGEDADAPAAAGVGGGGEVPSELIADLDDIPVIEEAVVAQDAAYDGFNATRSFWIASRSDQVIEWYVEELGDRGWSRGGDVDVNERDLDQYSEDPDKERRIVRVIHQLFERDGATIRVTAADDPYKDPSKGSGWLMLTVLRE